MSVQRNHRSNRDAPRKRARTMESLDGRNRGRSGLLARGALIVLGLAVATSGCDVNELLDVEPPDLIPAEGLATPENAELLVNGAIGDFDCAFGAYVALGAVMAHELIDATQTASRWPYDRRNLTSADALYGTFGCTDLGIYIPLSTARWSADNILGHLQEWTDQEVEGRQRLIALAAAYSGYAHLLIGEAFCTTAIDLSAELSSQEVLQRAIQRLDLAAQAAQAAGDDDILNFARVGRARAYLNLEQGADALANAQQVPPSFEWVATASGDFSRRANRIYAQNGDGPTGGTALSVGEQYRNLEYNGAPDPRVSVSDFIRVNADGTDLYYQYKYNALSDPLPIATGDEAQLIIAEVQGGTTAVNIINAFHERANLDPFAATASAAEIAEHVIQERSRELWLEGHRFHDIRRLTLPLAPAPNESYRKGGLYGTDRCFPLPDVERRNNPNVP